MCTTYWSLMPYRYNIQAKLCHFIPVDLRLSDFFSVTSLVMVTNASSQVTSFIVLVY